MGAGRRIVAALAIASLWASAPGVTAAPAPSALRFGVIAEEANEPDRMLRVYAPLLAELRKALTPKGIEVAPLVIAKDLSDLSLRLRQSEVDMVIETIFPTLELQERSSRAVTPLFAIVRRDQREYHSVFFAKKGGAIKTIQDLKGRTLVLQAERSTSAFAVPRLELARQGIRLVPSGQNGAPKNAAFYVLAGAELNQAIWVLNGKGDAGAFNEGDWARLPEKVRSELAIFHETRPLLRGVLSMRSGLDSQVRRACEEILLGLHQTPTGQRALASAAGITRFEKLTARDLAHLDEWRLALKGVRTP
jgi:phosphonate transport system substrate-binding protein